MQESGISALLLCSKKTYGRLVQKIGSNLFEFLPHLTENRLRFVPTLLRLHPRSLRYAPI